MYILYVIYFRRKISQAKKIFRVHWVIIMVLGNIVQKYKKINIMIRNGFLKLPTGNLKFKTNFWKFLLLSNEKTHLNFFRWSFNIFPVVWCNLNQITTMVHYITERFFYQIYINFSKVLIINYFNFFINLAFLIIKFIYSFSEKWDLSGYINRLF